MSNLVDANDLSALWAALRNHPDHIATVTWCVDDVVMFCKDNGIDPDSVDIDRIDLRGWEDTACGDGWDAMAYEIECNTKEDA